MNTEEVISISDQDLTSFFTSRVESIESAVVEAAPKVWEYTNTHIMVDAVTSAVLMIALFLTVLITFIKSFKYANRHDTWDDYNPGASAIIAIISGVLSVVMLIILTIASPSAVSKIVIPEYHAMHDLAELVGLEK